MLRVGIEPATHVRAQSKTGHAFNHRVTVIGSTTFCKITSTPDIPSLNNQISSAQTRMGCVQTVAVDKHQHRNRQAVTSYGYTRVYVYLHAQVLGQSRDTFGSITVTALN
jgi:hypothetical protein